MIRAVKCHSHLDDVGMGWIKSAEGSDRLEEGEHFLCWKEERKKGVLRELFLSRKKAKKKKKKEEM